MLKTDVIAHFGTQKQVADAYGCTPQAVNHWGDVIPKVASLQLERITNGVLKHDPSLYGKIHRSGRPASND